MKILVIRETSTSVALGYYEALIRLDGKRKVFHAILQPNTDKILYIEKEYPSKKSAFEAWGV